MWLFLPFGFFSVVAVQQNNVATDRLFVRSRDRDDIAAMNARLQMVSREHARTLCLGIERCHGHGSPSEHVPSCPAYVPTHIVETPRNDYRFRIMIHRALWAAALADFASKDLTYPNFKAEVYRTQGLEREQLYAQIWSVVRRFHEARSERATVEHKHSWERTPEDDDDNVTRYKCACGARGWCTRHNRLRLGSKAEIHEYKHAIPKTKREVTAQGQRTSSGRVGGGIGWHGRAK